MFGRADEPTKAIPKQGTKLAIVVFHLRLSYHNVHRYIHPQLAEFAAETKQNYIQHKTPITM